MTKRFLLFLGVGALVIAAACSDDSSGDGGSDATAESSADLCDTDAFTGNGNACPHESTRICFPICEASDPGGCVCKSTANGPVWNCTYPDDCKDPCGNTSPNNDADCPDVNDGGIELDANDAGDADDADDASDADDAG